MAAEGLRIQTKQGWFTVPYDHVLGIEPVRGALRFRVPPPYHFVDVETAGALIGAGLGPDDRDALIKQIMSASARARGLGTSKNDVSGRIDVLRRNGESPRDWLARLDMAGRMLESSTAGYRGHTLDTEDLWAVLEDPDAEGDLRAAAARVLRHSQKPETRQRIDAAVAAVRDDATNRRLRIAIRDDVDNASQELAVLDAQEGQEMQQAARLAPRAMPNYR
jgi:small-conductance mechanosensitive channel